ncbi:hypothetical protein COOONC_15976 [Cooperia oncophora]
MFPAYANAAAEEKEEGECEDGPSYSSFETQQQILEARARKQKRAKEERMLERKKNEAVLRYIYSEDEDDDEVQVHVQLPTPYFTPVSVPKVDLPISKKKKKKSKNKKRRNQKPKRPKRPRASSSSSSDASSDDRNHEKGRSRSRRSSTSSTSFSSESEDHHRKRKQHETPKLTLKKEKWEFLRDKEERSNEGSYIGKFSFCGTFFSIFHNVYDHEIFQMDSIPKGHTTDYRNRFYTILNGNERLDELFFSKETRELRQKRMRSDRYYGGQLRRLDDSIVERKFRKLEPLYRTNTDFIALSKTRMQEFKYLHEIAERKRMEQQQQALNFDVELTTPPELIELEKRRRHVATEFTNNSSNSELLDEFLKINEEIFDSSGPSGSAGGRKALAERQLSIIDPIEFRLKRLQFLKEIRPSGELLAEWERILNAFVNNCSMWEKYIDFIQYDMALYSSEVLEKAFDRCFAKLGAILDGAFKSHKPEENTEVFLLHMYVRRLMWWMERGFTNRAVASVQASVEYNLRAPASLVNAPEKQKLEAFAKFWNSGVPRFGDRQSRGWDDYFNGQVGLDELRDPEIIEREVQTQLILALEER